MEDNSVVVRDGDDDDESKIVTKFLLDTCRAQRPFRHHAQATAVCSAFVAQLPPPPLDDKTCFVPLVTGSSAEFYIQPALSCVGDIDIMYHRSDFVAIQEGYPPPTELPAEFHNRVEVGEIIDSEYPGYVYLIKSYLLTEDTNAGKYNAIGLQSDRCLLYVLIRAGERITTEEIHGPAVTRLGTKTEIPADGVPCVRCLSWPSQAADWPTRLRNNDWPDSSTVDRVVGNGCDVVKVAYPLCRQDEWMNEYQFRLSFSRAEIVLFNSVMPLQQIVYHMLRVFVKTERLTDIKSTDSSGEKNN